MASPLHSFKSSLGSVLDRKSSRRQRADRLIAASRFEEADRLLASCIARDPDDLDWRLQYAYSAHNSGRHADAFARWDHIRTRWPDQAMAWSATASNLREMGRVDEARVFIEEALRRFPDDLVAISEAIRIFDRLGDAPRSLALSGDVLRLVPHLRGWRKTHFQRLMAASRVEEASALLDDANEADLEDLDLAFHASLVALRRNDWARAEQLLETCAPPGDIGRQRIDALRNAALERRLHQPEEARILWLQLRRIDPDDPSILHYHCDTLIRCGRYVDAGTEIAMAIERHPDLYDFHFDRALLALKTERWDEAIEKFETLLRRRPTDEDAQHFLSRAKMDRAQTLLEAGGSPSLHAPSAAERQDVGLVEDEDVRNLLLGFESIGQDCEFGLLQRRFGAEPIGLFRWNFNETEVLRRASDVTFEGFGDPECTLMGLWEDYEYYVADRRWGFGFHTWINRHEVDRDALFAKMCRRITFLRTKFLDDLASGEKIFVHKTFTTDLDSVRKLLESLRAHGPVRLLWVRALETMAMIGDPPTANQRTGVVDEIEPGFYTGYLSAFGNASGTWRVPFDEWVQLCRAAVALRPAG